MKPTPLRRLTGLAAMAMMLTACSSEPPEQTAFDDQLETMERARDVEKVLEDRAAQIGERYEADTEEEDPQN